MFAGNNVVSRTPPRTYGELDVGRNLPGSEPIPPVRYGCVRRLSGAAYLAFRLSTVSKMGLTSPFRKSATTVSVAPFQNPLPLMSQAGRYEFSVTIGLLNVPPTSQQRG